MIISTDILSFKSQPVTGAGSCGFAPPSDGFFKSLSSSMKSKPINVKEVGIKKPTLVGFNEMQNKPVTANNLKKDIHVTLIEYAYLYDFKLHESKWSGGF
jgi:hypothetical protein